MTRMLIGLISISLLAMFGGCRSCGTGGCCLFRGAGNQIIAPPATFGMNGQQPYYNTAQQPGYMVNPNLRAPTPVGNSPSLAPQEGWRKAGDSTELTNQPNSNAPVSVLANNQPPANRVASLDPNAGFYNSQQSSVNYQSTSIDERQDDTRIPVTDASQVRAPEIFYSPATFNNNQPSAYNRTAQALYGNSINANNNAQFQGSAPVLTTPGQTIVNGQIVGGQMYYSNATSPYQPNYNGMQPAYQNYGTQAPTIVAQATAEYDPRNNPNYANGWRDREMTTDNIIRQ